MRKKITNLFLYTNTSTHAFCREKNFPLNLPFKHLQVSHGRQLKSYKRERWQSMNQGQVSLT